MNTEPDAARPAREATRSRRSSDRGDDTRANTEFSCFPQNETSIAVNPHEQQATSSAGRTTTGSAGRRRASTPRATAARHWYDGWIPFPSLPNGDNLDGGGDPALVFDRAGIAYYADINFNRTDDTNGVWVSRSTNGGFTWSRPCVPSLDRHSRPCGGPGDPRQPGDGTVAFTPENQTTPPVRELGELQRDLQRQGVHRGRAATRRASSRRCFTPESKTPVTGRRPGCPAAIIGSDRLYVTWTRFTNPVGTPGFITDSKIVMSYSDDQGHSWSPQQAINGSAPFCAFAFAGGRHATTTSSRCRR